MTALQSRILVSLIGVPILLYVVLGAPMWALAVMLALLSGIGADELLLCVSGGKREGLFHLSTLLAAALVPAFVFWRREWVAPLLVLYCLAAFAAAVARGGELRFAQLMAGVFAVVAIPYAFSAFLRIQVGGHRGYLLLPFVFSFASDTFAYFTGRAIGRHKLAPKVSPNKTVEGALGGLAGNAAGGLIFAAIMDYCCGESLDYLGVVVAGILCSVIAQLGDLSFSLIKREFGIKDYGKLFLAHGGVLDRFDSVLFVAPVLALLLPQVL